MNLKGNTIIFILLITLFSTTHKTNAEVPFAELMGIYDETDPNASWNSPLWGAVLLKSGALKNMRLLGNYGNEEVQDLPPHSAFKGKKQYNCPQDPVAALIQYLFPSPDGAILTHNDRNKDPIGIIAKTKDFAKLKTIINFTLFLYQEHNESFIQSTNRSNKIGKYDLFKKNGMLNKQHAFAILKKILQKKYL